MSSIPDITEAELWAVDTTLAERWPSRQIETQIADVEIRMYPHDRELTLCPAIYWEVDNAGFVIIKSDEKRYRCQFYYRGYQQYGTGKSEFDDITSCVVTMLQVHADKEAMNREEAGLT